MKGKVSLVMGSRQIQSAARKQFLERLLKERGA